MKLLSAPHAADFAGFLLALGSYAVFLFLAVVTRVGKGPAPQAKFNRLHLRTAVVYPVAWGVYFSLHPLFRFSLLGDFLVGLFIYFGIHYAVVGPFFVLAQASISTSILSIIHGQRGQATLEQCDQCFASGRGFGSIKQTRMSRLEQMLGWVTVRDGRYSLTRTGVGVARLTKLLLAIWGLRQIGKAP